MNIQEAHRQFKLFLDKVSTDALPEFSHKQIDIFIHEAEVRLVKQSYGQNNIYKAGYQEIQKRTDDLNTLVKTAYLKPEGDSVDGVYSFPLSSIYSAELADEGIDNYMFFIKGMCKVESLTVTPAVYTGITLIPQDKYTEVIKDPFNSSKIHSPIAFFEDNSIKIDTNNSSFEPKFIRITYIKYPNQVTWDATLESCINSELPEQKQREALQLAVTIALESVESQRTSTQAQLLSGIE